jgi:uncharacterized protein (TIGR03437 family)
MNLPLRKMRPGVLLAAVVLTAYTGPLFGSAPLLTATLSVTASPTLTCDTKTGPGQAAGVTLSFALAAGNSVATTFALPTTPSGLHVTYASSSGTGAGQLAVGTGTGAKTTYTIALGANCAGLGPGTTTIPYQISVGGTGDASVNIIVTVTSTAVLTTTPATGFTLTCPVSGGSNVQQVNVSSAYASTPYPAANTPFTVTPPPGWLAVKSASSGGSTYVGGNAPTGGSSTSFYVSVPDCSGGTAGASQSFTLHLAASPAPDAKLVIQVVYVGNNPLTVVDHTTQQATLTIPTYNKNSGAAVTWGADVTSTPSGVVFSVDASSMPNWLSVDFTLAVAPKTLTFTSTPVADNLSPGQYPASVHLKVSGSADFVLSIKLNIKNPLPKLTVAEGLNRNITWFVGNTLPQSYVTAVSSDGAIPFTLAAHGAINQPTQGSGVALTSGTQIPITFASAAFQTTQPGGVITGSLDVNWGTGSGATITTVNFTVAVQQAGSLATLTSISPTSLPTAAIGQKFTVTLYGSGFIPSSDPKQMTNVGVLLTPLTSNAMVADSSNIVTTVVNSSTIVLTITVATGDTTLGFGAPKTVTLGVCNPSGGTCSAATGGTQTLAIGSGPVISAVTSGSSFLPLGSLVQGTWTAASTQGIAPYDIISIFGNNFCSSNGTGCDSSTVLYGTPDATTFTLPSQLSPDGNQRVLTVTFQKTDTHAVVATAPLLFATNTQINCLVPSSSALLNLSAVDVVVSFGPSATPVKSINGSTVNIATSDPGIFTIDSNGDGAILNGNGIVGPGAEASILSDPAVGNAISIYMTGLGIPGSNTGQISDPNNYCMGYTNYENYVGSLTSLDGVVIQSSILSGHLPPCFGSSGAAPSSTTLSPVLGVTIGGVSAPVTYAGWVADSIAGLYQVNVSLPSYQGASPTFTPVTFSPALSGTATAVALPVLVTMANGNTSQANVNIQVKPRLSLVPTPTHTGALTAGNYSVTAGDTTTTIVTCAESSGMAGINYTITPDTMAVSTGGVVTLGTTTDPGHPIQVTVNATDGGTPATTGSCTFLLTIN